MLFRKVSVAALFVMVTAFAKSSHGGIIEHTIDVFYDGNDVAIEYTGDSTLETGSLVSLVFRTADNAYWTNMTDFILFPVIPVIGEIDWRYGTQEYTYSLNGDDMYGEPEQFASAAYAHIFDSVDAYTGDFDSLRIDFLFTRTKNAGTTTVFADDLGSMWYGTDGLPFNAEFATVQVDSPPTYLLLSGLLLIGLWRRTGQKPFPLT